MLVRWGIRIVTTLAGIALGLILSTAFLGGFDVSVAAIVPVTIFFWLVHLVLNFIALRILVRQPSVAMAGLLALASTILALVIVNLASSGLDVSGVTAYVLGTLIIWICTVLGDLVGNRMIRERRREARA